jgi:hypothetical protein
LANKSDVLLKSRKFTLNDQWNFAHFSGDTNPIHIDPIAARRTISGACIVHGINGLMWALNALVEQKGLIANSLKVRFIKPIFLDETVECIWNEENHRLSLVSDGILLTVISVKMGSFTPIHSTRTKNELPLSGPKELTFYECSSLAQQPLFFRGNNLLGEELFPEFAKGYGLATACELALTSEIVGMECPGLNSLFLSLKIEFRLDSGSNDSFQVKSSDDRYQMLWITIDAPTLYGEIEVLYRPSFRNNSAISDYKCVVAENEFRKISALILGGSRGLGAVVAKLIACGGGETIVTYNVGLDDAAKLKKEVEAFGGRCEIRQLTIANNISLPFDISNINQLYYFATPKIFGKRSSKFDNNLFNKFSGIYVESFDQLCRAISVENPFASVLYPSTIAIEEPLPELIEYVAAKSKGEDLCRVLNDETTLTVLYPRFPRIETDQTQSLVKVPSANAVDILLPLIREMTSLVKDSN